MSPREVSGRQLMDEAGIQGEAQAGATHCSHQRWWQSYRMACLGGREVERVRES